MNIPCSYEFRRLPLERAGIQFSPLQAQKPLKYRFLWCVGCVVWLLRLSPLEACGALGE